MESVELKRCPFCGGEAKIFASQDGGICVKCVNCYCQTENNCDFNYDECIRNNAFENVVAAWNRRAVMKNYDGFNGSFGTTKVKVFFQSGEYKGTMIYKVEGNCKGMSALPRDGMSILENVETAEFHDMNIIPYDNGDWFAKIFLTKAFNDTLEHDVESEAEFENMIVGVQIVDFKKENKEG